MWTTRPGSAEGPRLAAGQPRTQLWVQIGLALVLLGGCLLADRAGQVLLAPAAVLIALHATRDLVLGPALTADAEGVTVVEGFRRLGAGWDEVDRLRVVTDRRAPLLELDLGGRLVVLSRLRLGEPPSLVLEQLEDLRPAR